MVNNRAYLIAACLGLLFSSGCQCQEVVLSRSGRMFCHGCVIVYNRQQRILTAYHCEGGIRVGQDAAISRIPAPVGMLSAVSGREREGAGYCRVRRNGRYVRVDLTLTYDGFAGYITSKDFSPVPGDSGTPIFQNGVVVAVISAVTIHRPTFGIHSLIPGLTK